MHLQLVKTDFKQLQELWYEILEESGFEDIEKLVNGKLVLKQMASHSFWDKDNFDREMNEEYFRCLSHRVEDEDTVYRNDVDAMVLQLYADGLKIEQIVKTLRTTGIPFLRRKRKRHRHSVRAIIQKYEVQWNVKRKA